MNPNPFALDGVIRILLEEADIPTLKTLRELDSNWNSLDLKELEIRASKAEFHQYNFSWGHKGNNLTEEKAQEELANFLKSTMAIPQLFRDFRLHFPPSFNILKASFFSQYHPNFIRLDFDPLFRFDEDSTKLLHNFLRWVAPSIKELVVRKVNSRWRTLKIQEIFEIPEDQLIFPKLNKFSMITDMYAEILPDFGVILDKGKEVNPTPNLKELEIARLNTDLGNLLGIDPRSTLGFHRWSSLTRLTLYANNYGNDILKITKLLCNLAQHEMTLTQLDLDFKGEYQILGEFYEICLVLNDFLGSQSQSLEDLSLSFMFFVINTRPQNFPQGVDEEIVKKCSILLPIFPKVFKLTFGRLFIKIYEVIKFPLQMDPFPHHFPKLTSLQISHPELVKDLFGEVNLEPWPVKELVYFDSGLTTPWTWDQTLVFLRNNFTSVSRFVCNHEVINGLGILPWADTLEFLQIYIVTGAGYRPLKLASFGHLKYLVVYKHFIQNSGNVYRNSIHAFLEGFKEALQLNLTVIRFLTEKEICDEDKDLIRSYFPFEVEFTIKNLIS